jgi:uncharacterized protein (DUF2236 family)
MMHVALAFCAIWAVGAIVVYRRDPDPCVTRSERWRYAAIWPLLAGVAAVLIGSAMIGWAYGAIKSRSLAMPNNH